MTNTPRIFPAQRYLFWLFIGLLFFLFMYAIRSILLPFVLGAAIAYFLDPAADKLENWRFSRLSATAIITLSFFTALVTLLLFIIPAIANQFALLIADMPGYYAALQQKYESQVTGLLGSLPSEYMDGLKDALSKFSGIILQVAGDMAGDVFKSGMAIVNLLSLFLLTPVVAFYLLRDWDKLVIKFHSYLPRSHEKTIREQLSIINATLAGFIRGQMNVCLLLMFYYTIALSLVGLKFSILIGLMTGTLVIIPYLGVAVSMLTGLTVAYLQFGSFAGIAPTLIIFIAGQLIEGYFITPKLVGEKVGLHPVWIIFGMLAGATLFGFVGVLIAVPVTAVIGVVIRFALGQYLHSTYYSGGTSAKKP